MSKAETPYIETEFLIRVMNMDEEGARRIMKEMGNRELNELRNHLRRGMWWVDDEQATRYANSTDERGNDPAGDVPAGDSAQA